MKKSKIKKKIKICMMQLLTVVELSSLLASAQLQSKLVRGPTNRAHLVSLLACGLDDPSKVCIAFL